MSVRVKGFVSVSKNLRSTEAKFQRNMDVMVGAFAGRLEAKAAKDRPWTDRTNDARNSITGTWKRTDIGWLVVLAIGVEYGVFLELAHGGKYRVIRPTVDAMRQEFRKIPKDAMEAAR